MGHPVNGKLRRFNSIIRRTLENIGLAVNFENVYIKNILNYTFRSVMVFPNVKMQVTKNRKFALRSKFFFSSGWCIRARAKMIPVQLEIEFSSNISLFRLENGPLLNSRVILKPNACELKNCVFLSDSLIRSATQENASLKKPKWLIA